MKRAFLSLLACAAFAGAAPNQGPFKKIAVIHLRDTSKNMIDEALRESTLRRLEAAKNWGADCIVLDIESYGGLVIASMETADEIYALGQQGIHTIAYVGRKAISCSRSRVRRS